MLVSGSPEASTPSLTLRKRAQPTRVAVMVEAVAAPV